MTRSGGPPGGSNGGGGVGGNPGLQDFEQQLQESNRSLLESENFLLQQERDTLKVQLDKYKMMHRGAAGDAGGGGGGGDLYYSSASARMDQQARFNECEQLRESFERAETELIAMRTRQGTEDCSTDWLIARPLDQLVGWLIDTVHVKKTSIQFLTLKQICAWMFCRNHKNISQLSTMLYSPYILFDFFVHNRGVSSKFFFQFIQKPA